MLSAVPDLIPQVSWAQVLGRVALHHSDGDSIRLTGSGQRLLAVFVAAGPDGATAERLAQEIWGDAQPNPWRPALRMAIARLRKQLPSDWEIVADGGSYQVTTASGWVDAWRLSRIATESNEIAEVDLDWALAGVPFADVDSLELVAASTQHLQMLQVTIAERFCLQQPAALSTRSCGVLSALLREHPFNDGLAMVIAKTLANADRRTEAVLALRSFSEVYSLETGVVPAELAHFLSTAQSTSPLPIDPSAQAPPPAPAGKIAKELRHLLDTPMLGGLDQLETLRNAAGAVVTGVSGSGKSRLVAELISTNLQIETTYVVGDDRLELPLGPFAVAVPSLRDDLLGTDSSQFGPESDAVERAIATHAWRVMLAHLETQAQRRPQRLVVDDAHLLDAASLALLRLLIRSNTSEDVSFVVCGRSDFDDVAWLDLVSDAKRAGLEPVHLAGLDSAELEQLVYEAFPTASHQARHGLVVDVEEASDGLPAVVGPLIASADPQTLALPDRFGGTSGIARLTGRFAESSSEVIASAAVLGHQFSIGALIELTALSESEIFRVLDELWSAGMIIETDDPDQVRFRHMLMQRAFLEGLPLFRRGQLHRRAAELTSDPHERADHHANAGALVPAVVAAGSLRQSAELYAQRLRWRKVARELRRIDDLPGELLDSRGYALWAAALDQSGSDGSAQRRIAYNLASTAQDWEAALVAALSGLPKAEKIDGDAERVTMLRAIPASALSGSRHFERVYYLSRLLSAGGDFEAASRYGDEALTLASTPDEVILGHILRWTATRYRRPGSYEVPVDVGAGSDSPSAVRLMNVQAIDFAERGDFAASRDMALRFRERAEAIGDPVLLWHARTLQNMHHLNDARLEEAQELAVENLKLAEVHDIQYGHAAYMGYQVHLGDLLEQLPPLADALEPFRANLMRFVLGRTALILIDDVRGRPTVDADLQTLLATLQERSDNSSAVVAKLLLARLVVDRAPEQIAPVRSTLEKFGDKPILSPHGGGNYGPTTRYVAQLSVDPDEKAELLDQSIIAADQQGPLVWRVHTRLDRGQLGCAQSMTEAAELATGTALAPVVESRIAGLG